MPNGSIQNWGEALLVSLTGALGIFLAAIPKIIGFIIILAVGWFIATLIAKAVTALLRTVHFNDLAQRSGFSGLVQKMGAQADASNFLATTVKWFIRLIALVVAFDALGLPAVSDVLRRLLLWIPNLIVALVVLVIGGLAAGALARLVRGAAAQADLGNPTLLANIASIAVWAFAIVIAVNQIGVATTLVNTLFMGVVAALTLALGLAFGLGGRETAGEIVRNWYRRGQAAAPNIAEAAKIATEKTQSGAPH